MIDPFAVFSLSAFVLIQLLLNRHLLNLDEAADQGEPISSRRYDSDG